ncbi:ribonuclease T2 [Hanseniaspora valbyensis NRRL Y-1626]|uniref:Ribonuclease T2-like n=1 Tax=Hanseniaspora valbyensis NRRL Y-1626 TaxID=766949 RepID=A0A1B7TH36_9ASCO|nr:ribonuclease T2 [Hanseniaspora valbyensis NRRL Y-1626]
MQLQNIVSALFPSVLLLKDKQTNQDNFNSLELYNSPLSCPIDTPLSCSNTTVIEDSCCFEYPGGIFLQTQFWDYIPTIYDPKEELEKLKYNFTLHGLWPDNCDGSYAQFCDLSRDIKYNLTDMLLNQDLYQSENLPYLSPDSGLNLVNDLKQWWKSNNGNDESLWVHEYNKHGTCINTMKPNCYSRWFENESVTEEDPDEYQKLVKRGIYDYFDITMKLYKNLNTFEFLQNYNITPSEEKTYTRKEISEALSESFNDKQVFFKCDRYKGLNEIWYYHLLARGSPILNDIDSFEAIDSFKSFSNCPETGIHFYPKGYSPPSYSPPPSRPGNGKKKLGTGSMRISTKKGTLTGFLTNKGKWMSRGTEANYELYDAEFGNINIRTRMGYCSVNAQNMFECGSKYNKNPMQFNYDENSGIISCLGKETWYAERYPSGRIQSNVYLKQGNEYKDYEFKLKFNKKY